MIPTQELDSTYHNERACKLQLRPRCSQIQNSCFFKNLTLPKLTTTTKKNPTIPCADKIQRNYNPHVLLVGVQNGTATLGNSLAVSYKVKPLLYICLFLGDYPREVKTFIHIQTYTQISSSIHNPQKLEVTQMSFKG